MKLRSLKFNTEPLNCYIYQGYMYSDMPYLRANTNVYNLTNILHHGARVQLKALYKKALCIDSTVSRERKT